MVLRNGTSWTSSTEMRVSTDTPAAIKNSTPNESPYAERTISWMGAGRSLRSRLAPADPPEGTPAARNPAATFVATWLASTAPSTATPTAPPRERKNETVAEVAPTWETSTVFCTASTMFWISAPIPTPMIDMKMATCQNGVVWSKVPIRASPTTSITDPNTISGFHRPVRVTSCPPMVELSIWAMISGIVIRPAWVGVWPPASWKYCVRNVLLPNMATPTPTLARIISSVVRLRSTRIGTIGSLTLSSVTMVNATAAAKPARYAADCHEMKSKSSPAKVTHSMGSAATMAISTAPT